MSICRNPDADNVGAAGYNRYILKVWKCQYDVAFIDFVVLTVRLYHIASNKLWWYRGECLRPYICQQS